MKKNEGYLNDYAALCKEADRLEPEMFDRYEVQRGLRDKNGNGVVTGLTNISRIDSFQVVDGKKTPCEGKLWYRGYDCIELVKGFRGKHTGFEEVAYLLLFGELPTQQQLKEFREILSTTRSVLTLASYDKNCSDTGIENVLRQCIGLISVFPMLSVYGYHAYNHYQNDESMYIHRPSKKLSTAENLLMMLRPDKKYTELEAEVLDIALVLHMEHGGGNNSTFTTRVVTSSGADTYSVIAAALSSLKGPKHGGANIKVVEMMRDLKKNVADGRDEEEVRAYLKKILNREAFDRKGLIYGMGHAVYSLSDPRAQVFKGFVRKLAEAKGREKDFALYSMIERMAPEVISEKARIYKGVSANVDFYSGFVYSMLEIPLEMYTPIFAIARIVGWSAHRIEELINMDKIIRPAYKSVMTERKYVEIADR